MVVLCNGYLYSNIHNDLNLFLKKHIYEMIPM
jgi:hypothetical protein